MLFRSRSRDGNGGSRDLASLVVAIDHKFRPDPGVENWSDLQLEAAIMPVKWLRFEAFSKLDIEHPELNELNTGISVIDGRYWSAGISTHFLRQDIEEYDLRVMRRINEEFSAGARFRYDARTDSLYEQTYSLRQTIRNLWAIDYEISFQERLRREGSVHFRIAIDLLDF